MAVARCETVDLVAFRRLSSGGSIGVGLAPFKHQRGGRHCTSGPFRRYRRGRCPIRRPPAVHQYTFALVIVEDIVSGSLRELSKITPQVAGTTLGALPWSRGVGEMNSGSLTHASASGGLCA